MQGASNGGVRPRRVGAAHHGYPRASDSIAVPNQHVILGKPSRAHGGRCPPYTLALEFVASLNGFRLSSIGHSILGGATPIISTGSSSQFVECGDNFPITLRLDPTRDRWVDCVWNLVRGADRPCAKRACCRRLLSPSSSVLSLRRSPSSFDASGLLRLNFRGQPGGLGAGH